MNDRRGSTRRAFIIILSVLTAVTTAILALFHRSLGQGLSVLLGYVILLLSSALLNVCIIASSDDTKRTALLIFSLGILVFFLGGIIYILFSNEQGGYASYPTVAEAHITEHQAEVIGGSDAETSIKVVSEDVEGKITPTINYPPTAFSEEEEEPFSLPISESYHIGEENYQSESSDVIVDNEEIPSSPMVSFAVTDIKKEPVTITSEVDEIVLIPSSPSFSSVTTEIEPASPYVFNIESTPSSSSALFIDEEDTEQPAKIAEAAESDNLQTVAETGTESVNEPSSDSFFSGLSQEEADFWASFYIAGEDDLELEDGIYYMSLFINDINYGEITTLIENGNPSLLVSELRTLLTGTLTEAAFNRVFLDRGEYISLSDLDSIGVRTSYDLTQYEIRLVFDLQDMPVQILSLSGSSSRAIYRPIADGINLNPVAFSLLSRYSFNVDVRNFKASNLLDQLSFSFSSSNYARLYDVYLNFSYYMYFTPYSFRFNLGSYKFYYDFPDQMLRLSWGNVSSDLLSPSGTAIGVEIEKSLSYSGSNYSTRSNGAEQLIVVEKRSDVEVFNEGRSIFKRTLDPGTYQLRDFILYSGANRITICISPLDGSAPQELELDILYSASLLSPGETYYGASLVMSRSVVPDNTELEPGVLAIPLWNNRRIEYDFRDITLSGHVRTGLSSLLTLDFSLAVQNKPEAGTAWKPNASAAIELTNLTNIGTTRYNIDIDEQSDDDGVLTPPSVSLRASHQIPLNLQGLSTITFGFAYYSPENWIWSNQNILSLNASLSGSYGILGWSLSSRGAMDMSNIGNYSWAVTSSLSLSLSRYLFLSASLAFNGSDEIPSYFTGRISATLRFGSTGITASTSGKDVSARLSTSTGNHSIAANMRSYSLASFDSYSFDASYGYSGKRLNFSFGVDASRGFDTIGGGFDVSTSTVFADGLFAIASSIPSNFLLVRQEGALKGNTISIGSIGTSSSSYIPMTFGTGLYTGLPSYRSSGLSIYSSSGDSFGATQSVNANIITSSRQGYILRMEAEETYSVSGVVETDGVLWTNGASPVYRITIEDNMITTDLSDLYLFTDSDGRFVMSDLSVGLYGFDVQDSSGEWNLFIFEVPDEKEAFSYIRGFDSIKPCAYELSEPYRRSYMFGDSELMTSEEFFMMLYPEMEAAV